MHFLPQGEQHMVFISDCRLMSAVSLYSVGGDEEGSREAAASERRRGLGDLHGGHNHLISSPLIQFLFLALFRD